jgi:SNF2 family DNA or RNA helicase
MNTPTLYDHQKDTSGFLLKTDGHAFITSDPGTGKTASVLVALEKMIADGYISRVLVLAPKAIVEAAWGEDAITFTPKLKVKAVIGSTNKKMEVITDKRYQIVATNHDTVRFVPEKVLSANFDAIVVDESTRFKNPTAVGTKVLLRLAKTMKFVLPMTGTPMPLSILDMWVPLRLARPDKMTPLFSKFRLETCTPVSKQWGMEWVERQGIREALVTLYSDTIIRYAKEDCVDLPPQSMHTKTVELSTALRKAYDKFETDCLLEFDSGDVSAPHAGAMAMKLSQLASGFLYGEGEHHKVSPERYELATEIVAERKHSLVAFMYTAQRDFMKELLDKEGIKYEVLDGSTPASRFSEIVDEFQRGMYQTLLCQPQSVAHGVTLTKADTIIWLSPPRSLEHFVQFCARIDRIGQKQANEVIMLQAKGTYEVKAYKRLMDKNVSQLDLLSLLKE